MTQLYCTLTPPPSSSDAAAASSSADSSATPPVLQVNGDNPAIIHVGATYNDLGAQITAPLADLNLGITTYVNGAPMNPVQIDTTQAATDTIDYDASARPQIRAEPAMGALVQDSSTGTGLEHGGPFCVSKEWHPF